MATSPRCSTRKATSATNSWIDQPTWDVNWPLAKTERAPKSQELALTTIVKIRATDQLMSAVYALRRQVFVIEQGVPEDLEVDENDKAATHLAALSDGHVIGTLRIVRHERTAQIGRMAVSAHSRKKGIGRELMEFAAAAASRDGAQEIILAAQFTAREFYKQLGYIEEGAVFDEAGISHVMMRKRLRP